MTVGVAIPAKGMTVTWNSAAIGLITGISGFTGSAVDMDKTTMASTAKEFQPGLKDNGTFTVDIFRDVNDAGQAAVLAGEAAQTTANLVLVLATGTLKTATVSAYVKSMTSTGKIDGFITGQIVFRLTNDVVWS